ncbi:MAG: hypothetical protein JW774_08000, partial [Candidatus Aureabacteria bacterium]|nr:hypothetical protein [Candidatus Auribacterota bacterium]
MRRKDRFILLFIATAFIISEVPAATQKDHALLYPSLAPQSSLQGKKFNALIELAEFMASRQGGKRLDQQIVTELRRLEARRQQAQGRTARATAQATSKVAQDLLELSRHVIQDLRSNINIFADQLMGITQYKGDTYPPTIFGPILNAMTHGMPLAWDSQTGRKTAGLFITDHNAGGERILSIFDIEFARQRAGGDYIPTLSRENALRLVTTLADQMERRIQEGVIAAVGERICTDTARKLRDASPSNPYRPEAINKLRQTLQAVNSASSAQENPMSKTLIGIILDVSRTNPLLIVSNLTELVSRSKPNSSGETVVSVLGIPFAKEKRTDGRLTAISAVDAESVDAKAARIIEALARYIESKAVKTAPAAQAAPATRDTQLIIAQVLRAQAAKLRGKTNPERA